MKKHCFHTSIILVVQLGIMCQKKKPQKLDAKGKKEIFIRYSHIAK